LDLDYNYAACAKIKKDLQDCKEALYYYYYSSRKEEIYQFAGKNLEKKI